MAECIKHTCKDCIHFKICNDYEYLIGRETKVACPDFKSTEDVVPRSEVEELQKRLNDYERVCGELRFKENGNAVFLIGEDVEYVQRELANCLKNLAVKQAKQEVAKQVIEEFKDLVTNYMTNKELLLTVFKNAIAHAEAELRKKYIGE